MSANQDIKSIKTFGELKASGYEPKSVKDELRDNLITKIKSGEPIFDRVKGYEETVIPELERAILAKHNINLLGLRGQAKTTIARMMVDLLDEYIPAVKDSELNEDPFQPITQHTRSLLEEHGDSTPIRWIHRSERYTEKLATPDVTVADLIGDVDPIKAANLKLSYSDERVIHYGLVPHANRGLFVINELPDLQPRIQVALFNILQEGDIQIRGFNVRLPLDIQFVFTANPEDYTNRGAIITPLKDRIQSQILTHYPLDIETSKVITKQEAKLPGLSADRVEVPELVSNLLEQVTFAARESEFVDQKSGVSARLSVSAYECLVASAERRLIKTGESKTRARISDVMSVIPAITGKIELVYEGEQEGAIQVAHALIREAIRREFLMYYPSPEKLKHKEQASPFQPIIDWFARHEFELGNEMTQSDYQKAISKVAPLMELVEELNEGLSKEDLALHAEFVLHALAEYSLISKTGVHGSYSFNDMLNAMLR